MATELIPRTRVTNSRDIVPDLVRVPRIVDEEKILRRRQRLWRTGARGRLTPEDLVALRLGVGLPLQQNRSARRRQGQAFVDVVLAVPPTGHTAEDGRTERCDHHRRDNADVRNTIACSAVNAGGGVTGVACDNRSQIAHESTAISVARARGCTVETGARATTGLRRYHQRIALPDGNALPGEEYVVAAGGRVAGQRSAAAPQRHALGGDNAIVGASGIKEYVDVCNRGSHIRHHGSAVHDHDVGEHRSHTSRS